MTMHIYLAPEGLDEIFANPEDAKLMPKNAFVRLTDHEAETRDLTELVLCLRAERNKYCQALEDVQTVAIERGMTATAGILAKVLA